MIDKAKMYFNTYLLPFMSNVSMIRFGRNLLNITMLMYKPINQKKDCGLLNQDKTQIGVLASLCTIAMTRSETGCSHKYQAQTISRKHL